MPRKQQQELTGDETHQDSPNVNKQHVNDSIGRQVMGVLGRPEHLHMVQVRPLWDDRYRVNIFVGPDAASVRVAHSYFLMIDDKGTITDSIPKITKQY
jgi:hypothetical protein